MSCTEKYNWLLTEIELCNNKIKEVAEYKLRKEMAEAKLERP